jgi:hypothetical protein
MTLFVGYLFFASLTWRYHRNADARENLDIGRPSQVQLIFGRREHAPAGPFPHQGHHLGCHSLLAR